MKNPASRYILFIVFIILGLVMAVQFKSTLNSRKVTASNKLSADALKEQITEISREIEELRISIDESLAFQNEIIKEYIALQNDEKLMEEWNLLKLHTGLSSVSGPGVTITLDDASEIQSDLPLEFFIIHDYDVRQIVNDLKKAGAQAIAINGERMVPMSELICAGPTIIINKNRHPVPFVIEAIGDPDVLYDSLNTSAKINELREFNIKVEIKKSKEIKIAKFSGVDNLDRYISGLEVVEQ
jgi:uncharacterized protein YlxW (UPF0749 family)